MREAGVAAVYTPKDWDLNQMMRDIVSLVGEQPDDSAPARTSEAGSRAGGRPEGIDTAAPA
jgi:hypothetical protein